MLTTRFATAAAAAALLMSVASSHAAVVTDPTLHSGADAIDPKNQSVDITQIATGVSASATESSLEALASFRTVQDFTGFGSAGNIFSFTDSDVPDIRFTEDEPFPFGSGASDANIATSGTSHLRLGGQDATGLTLTIDFGSYDGADFTVDRSSDTAAFVVTDLRTDETVTVRYYSDANDLGSLLATQMYATPATTDEAIYFGYRGDGTSAQAVQRIVLEITGVSGGRFRGLDDLGFSIVPEPASLALLGLGGLALISRRRAA